MKIQYRPGSTVIKMVASGSRRRGALVSSPTGVTTSKPLIASIPNTAGDNDTVGAAGGRGRVKRRCGEGAAHALYHDDDHRQGDHEGRFDDHGHADHPRRDLHLAVGRGGHQGHHGQPPVTAVVKVALSPTAASRAFPNPEHDWLQHAGEGVLSGLNPADPRATRRAPPPPPAR